MKQLKQRRLIMVNTGGDIVCQQYCDSRRKEEKARTVKEMAF